MQTSRRLRLNRIDLRRLAVILALVAISLLLFPATPARAHEGDDQPTIVLVHGAWAGPGGWSSLSQILHREGFRTATPTLGLQTVADDVAIVRAALDSIEGPKILVGHSYGGFVISNAAYGRSDVRGLVYTAAFVPDQGDTLLALGAGYTPAAALPHLLFSGTPPTQTLIDPAFFPQDFAQDLSPTVAAVLNQQQRPFNLPIFFTPSGPVAWHALPTWFAVSGDDRMIDPALQRAEALKIGATTIEFKGASHASGYIRFRSQFAELIERAAESTRDRSEGD